MPRPRLYRHIGFKHKNYYFKPQGIPMRFLKEIALELAELEALRLKHILELDQVLSAKQMKISRTTYQRILQSAYKKITLAIIKGWAIKISKKHE